MGDTETTNLPDAIVQYLERMDRSRAAAVAGILTGLTERERALVKDAAVMGWVQGMRWHDMGWPGDFNALARVVDACLAFPDLYPAITARPSDDTRERLDAITQLASALQDYLPGDAWHIANAIKQVASGEITPAEALADDDEN